MISSNLAIWRNAPSVVVRWFGDLYYSGWKFGQHHDFLAAMLSQASQILSTSIEASELGLVADGIEAAAQLAGWLNQAGDREAAAIAGLLAKVYDRPGLPAAARKMAGTILATQIGYHTLHKPSFWARRVLADCREELVQHDLVHMLAASCASPEELVGILPALMSSVEEFARQTEDHFGADHAALEYRRSQLFEVIAPPIRGLLSCGRCGDAVRLAAAWFGVPVDRRRRSPVLGVVPGHDEGVLYAVEGRAMLYARDTDQAMCRLTAAVNLAFDLSIVLRRDRTLPPVKAGRRGQPGMTDELAVATDDFYRIDSLAEFLRDGPTVPLAAFHPHAEQTPFQALTLRRLGIAWPTVTSFQEPKPDRPLRRALIWSCGTILGGHEARSVAAYFTAHGVQCVMSSDESLTRDQFLELYQDESFDVLWFNGHGVYDAREPLHARIELSADKEHWVSVSDMSRLPIKGLSRRLLMLNICLGGTVLVSGAPARLGMAAILAQQNQAVIAHLSEVSSFVAPLFGALTAVGLIRTGSFFPAFCQALEALPGEHEHTLRNLIEEAPEMAELVERLSRGSPVVASNDITTWGTPVFYE